MMTFPNINYIKHMQCMQMCGKILNSMVNRSIVWTYLYTVQNLPTLSQTSELPHLHRLHRYVGRMALRHISPSDRL
jgi:hypothetical protein